MAANFEYIQNLLSGCKARLSCCSPWQQLNPTDIELEYLAKALHCGIMDLLKKD